MKIAALCLIIVHVTVGLKPPPPPPLTPASTSRFDVGENGDTFCSSFCVCDTWYKLRRASCNHRHLFSIQTGVSNAVQALDLSHNSVSALLDYELKNTGLVNLRYLNLSDNSINQIGSFAFSGINELTVLDLTRNHIYYVLWDTFIEIQSLRILLLNGNHFGDRIPDLQSNSISELGLSNCQISHVSPQTFFGLQQLRKLDLSNNFMIEIDARELKPLNLLREINLDDNPWSCSSMTQLSTYLNERKIQHKSPCEKEAILAANKTQVKMFEKMTDAREGEFYDEDENEDGNDDIDEKKIGPNRGEKNAWITERPFPISKSQNSSAKIARMNSMNGFLDGLSTVSPIWIFAAGFFLGAASSILGTYVWLTGIMSCRCPTIPRRNVTRTRDNHSQRVSLLGPTCPGTPPPPYRDVMLRSNAYPVVPPTMISVLHRLNSRD